MEGKLIRSSLLQPTTESTPHHRLHTHPSLSVIHVCNKDDTSVVLAIVESARTDRMSFSFHNNHMVLLCWLVVVIYRCLDVASGFPLQLLVVPSISQSPTTARQRISFVVWSSSSSSTADNNVQKKSLQKETTTKENERKETVENTPTNNKKKTLYEILGASPNDTREEIKKKYIQLARQAHPDATRQSTSSVASTDLDFAEIAAAWRILCDPVQRRRYDRTLQAQKFSQEISQWASELSQQPAVVDLGVGLLEHLALPLLRRTAATTIAGWNAIQNSTRNSSRSAKDTTQNTSTNTTTTATTEQPQPQLPNNPENDTTMDSESSTILHQQPSESDNFKKENEIPDSQRNDAVKPTTTTTTTTTSPLDLTKTLSRAFSAASKASRAVDAMELTEKAHTLEQKALQSVQKSVQVHATLRQVIAQRLELTLHTANAKITSTEAQLVMREFFDHAYIQQQQQQREQQHFRYNDDNDNNHNLQEDMHDHPTNNNNNHHHGFWERRKSSWVDAEIQTLAKLEQEFIEAQTADANIQEQYQTIVRERVQAQSQLDQAQRKEAELWKLYQQAKQNTVERRNQLERLNAEVRYAEHEAQKTSYEVEKTSAVLDRQSSVVRKMLATAYQREQKQQKHRQKRQQRLQQKQKLSRGDGKNRHNSAVSFEEFVVQQKAGGSDNPTDYTSMYPAIHMDEIVDKDPDDANAAYDLGKIMVPSSLSSKLPSLEEDHWWDSQAANTDVRDPENEERLRLLDEYQAQERELANLAESLEVEAAKLLSRAKKLRDRARELERS
jgi:curved DNA-binding protein CbpA